LRRRKRHSTQSHYNWPEIGQQSASTATREGVAARCAAPAVPKSLAVDWALSPSDDPRLRAGALSRVQAATHPDAHPRSLWQTVPGIGQLLRLVLLYDMHALARFPPGQDVGSSCRLVTCAKAAAGTRVGTSGKNIGHAHRQWAFAEAATLCLRHHPAGQHSRARLENKHAQGNALPILAHPLARAVSAMRKHQTACHLAPFLQSEGSRVGEPDASLDTQGMSLP
jgi:hypothetical protein